jgi:hypothetical protein
MAPGLIPQSQVICASHRRPVTAAFWTSPDNPGGGDIPLDPLPAQTATEINVELPTLGAHDIVVLSYED